MLPASSPSHRQPLNQGLQLGHPALSSTAGQAQLIRAGPQRGADGTRQAGKIEWRQTVDLDDELAIGALNLVNSGLARREPQADDIDQVLSRFRERTIAVDQFRGQLAELWTGG